MPELLRSYGTQTLAGTKYGVLGIPERHTFDRYQRMDVVDMQTC